MPLILDRKAGQKIVIRIAPSADPQECLRALLAEGIVISVNDISSSGSQVRMAVTAPRELLVLRSELAHD